MSVKHPPIFIGVDPSTNDVNQFASRLRADTQDELASALASNLDSTIMTRLQKLTGIVLSPSTPHTYAKLFETRLTCQRYRNGPDEYALDGKVFLIVWPPVFQPNNDENGKSELRATQQFKYVGERTQ